MVPLALILALTRIPSGIILDLKITVSDSVFTLER
jgi:hypothetical protein